MPVAGIEKKIDFDNSDKTVSNRFHKAEHNAILKPNYNEWVTKKLKFVPFDLYIYIIDTQETRDRIRPATSFEKLSKQLPFTSGFFDLKSEIANTELQAMNIPNLKNNFTKNPNAVHMLITHNDPYTDDWIMLTPHMILHRLGHACLDYGQQAAKSIPVVKKIKQYWMSQDTDVLIRYLGTKSAKKNKTSEQEMLIEMFSSYLTNGNIRFMYGPESDNAERSQVVMFMNVMNSYFEDLVEELKGKVWFG